MQRKYVTPAALALTAGSILFSLTAHRPAAQAAPTAPGAARPAVGSMADLLSGRLYPKTLRRTELAPNYRYITLIDGQGKPAECATKGDTVILAGETFLVAYLLFDAPKPAGAADAAPPPPDAQLTLINMRYVEAMGGIRDTPTPPPATAPAAAPAAGSTAAGSTAAGSTAGTAAP